MKLQVMCSDEICQRIDLCAKELGMTRSAFCMMILALGVSDWEARLRLPSPELRSDRSDQTSDVGGKA